MLYQWTRKDLANVRLALIIGTPFVLLMTLRAFREDGTTLLKILTVLLCVTFVALAARAVYVQRAFAREEGDANG